MLVSRSAHAAHAEDVVVDEVVVLAGRLVDAVDVGRPHQMTLGDRQRVGLAVDLPGAGVDDLGARIVMTAGLEQRQLAAAVDLEIGVRVTHAVDVTDLAGQVEDHVAPLHQVVHRAGLAHVGDVDVNPILDAGDVVQVAAVVGDQRIDQQHVGAEIGEAMGEVAADEAEAARDHHAAPAIELGVAHDGCRRPIAAARARCAARCSRLITSDHHSFITSMPVRAMRRKLKNCDLP